MNEKEVGLTGLNFIFPTVNSGKEKLSGQLISPLSPCMLPAAIFSLRGRN